MADWRQIQARIRKAKSSHDPHGMLAALYEKTRDAMVAFELAVLHEKSGKHAEAAHWYTAAAERFRRAQWKKKAEEALARLGAPVPFGVALGETLAHAPELQGLEHDAAAGEAPAETTRAREVVTESAKAEKPVAAIPARRRRGRRGGRGRRRGQQAQTAPSPASSSAATTRAATEQAAESQREAPSERVTRQGEHRGAEHVQPSPAPQRELTPTARPTRARPGDPALASRIAHLEAQLRRLIASPLHSVADADQAPAGPGVLVVSDSEQVTYYHIEACQTLRIAVGNLLRGERGGHRGEESLRARFAEHLGINDSRVSKYLKEHCTVRWLQLDEGAKPLAHFAIAVLRPALDD